MHRSEFLKELKLQFPELKDEIDKNESNIIVVGGILNYLSDLFIYAVF